MNNKEFIAELSRRAGYTQEQTQNYVRTLVEEMTNILGDGESVSIPSFGTFEVKKTDGTHPGESFNRQENVGSSQIGP